MAKIPAQLQKVVKAVSKVAANNALYATGKGSRQWNNFSALVAAGKFDFTKTKSIFDRSGVNSDYTGARASAKTQAKDLQVSKLGGDILAGMERDYRMRTRSRIRCFVHTAARAKANGVANGPLTLSSVGFLTIIAGDSQ